MWNNEEANPPIQADFDAEWGTIQGIFGLLFIYFP